MPAILKNRCESLEFKVIGSVVSQLHLLQEADHLHCRLKQNTDMTLQVFSMHCGVVSAAL